MCYRMFAKTWPDRSRRLFSSFDPVIQRVHVSFPLDVSILFLMINIFIESAKRVSTLVHGKYTMEDPNVKEPKKKKKNHLSRNSIKFEVEKEIEAKVNS